MNVQNLPLASTVQVFRGRDKQILSVFPAFLIATSSALHFSWTIVSSLDFDDIHAIITWFGGAIIGAFVASCFAYDWPKWTFYSLGGLLSLGSGIVLMFRPELEFILPARYIAGAAYGLVFIPGVIHAAEIADRRFRGRASSLVNLGMITAFSITSIIYITYDDMEHYHGIFCIAFASVGLISSFLAIESPTYLLLKNKDFQAEESLKSLRKATVATLQVQLELEDTRTLIRESKDLGSIHARKDVAIAITLLRIVYALSLSLPVVIQLTVWLYEAEMGDNSLAILFLCRFFAEIINTVLIDCLGHTRLMHISLGPSGVIILILIMLFGAKDYYVSIRTVVMGIVFYQICVGMGLGTASTVYLAQSFPVKTNKWSIFFIFTIEMLVHIATYYGTIVALYPVVKLFITLGSFSILIGILACCSLPDTTHKSLGECQR